MREIVKKHGGKGKYVRALWGLFILNILDILLTIVQLELFGKDVERNLMMEWIIENWGYVGAILVKFIVGLVICIYLYKRYDEEVMNNNIRMRRRVHWTIGVVLGFYGLVNVIHIINLGMYWGFRIYYG